MTSASEWMTSGSVCLSVIMSCHHIMPSYHAIIPSPNLKKKSKVHTIGITNNFKFWILGLVPIDYESSLDKVCSGRQLSSDCDFLSLPDPGLTWAQNVAPDGTQGERDKYKLGWYSKIALPIWYPMTRWSSLALKTFEKVVVKFCTKWGVPSLNKMAAKDTIFYEI